MNACTYFKKFMSDQKEALYDAIDENKWYLSEKEKVDVGVNVAKSNFLDAHLKKWADEFRKDYCKNKCVKKSECEFRSKI